MSAASAGDRSLRDRLGELREVPPPRDLPTSARLAARVQDLERRLDGVLDLLREELEDR